ncbi:MAG: class I SAM-dependent methyltransferase [Spirochaetota bacterium]
MKQHGIYPSWAAWFLVSPLRKIMLDPDMILGNAVREGMTVVEPGCGSGFFSIPIARLVGESGRVVCCDVQQGMLDIVGKRAEKHGLEKRIRTRLSTAGWLKIEEYTGKADSAVVLGVFHEVENKESFISDIARSLKKGGLLLMGEPKGPVNQDEYNESIALIQSLGFELEDSADFARFRTSHLRKK